MQASTAARYSRSWIFRSCAERKKEVAAVVNNPEAYRCGAAECSAKPQSNTSDLMRRLQKVDFAIVETCLYLDAYPHSREALAYYHKLITEQKMLKERLASLGRPITNSENTAKDQWLWTKGPWPWQIEAN
jgi:spore coat protein JB